MERRSEKGGMEDGKQKTSVIARTLYRTVQGTKESDAKRHPEAKPKDLNSR